MKHLIRGTEQLVLLPMVLAFALATMAYAGTEKVEKHPGYVDGAHLVDLADEDGKLIEITLKGRLLNVLTQRAVRRHDEGLAEILSQLVAIHAVIAEVGDDRLEAESEIRAIRKQLEKDGWERFVRIRENGQEFGAYMHLAGDGDDDDQVDGLVVIGFTDEAQLVFVNIAGTIDMERIAALGQQLGMPGLEDLPPKSEVDARKKKERDT